MGVVERIGSVKAILFSINLYERGLFGGEKNAVRTKISPPILKLSPRSFLRFNNKYSKIKSEAKKSLQSGVMYVLHFSFYLLRFLVYVFPVTPILFIKVDVAFERATHRKD